VCLLQEKQFHILSSNVCQNEKPLCLQCKSYQQNQQIVLRISFLNSTFPSKGTKKGHALRLGHHASHICHRSYCGFANNQFQLLGYELSNENEQFSEAHAYLVPAGLRLGSRKNYLSLKFKKG